MNKKTLAIFLIIIFICFPVYSQEYDNIESETDNYPELDSEFTDIEPQEDSVFIVNSFLFNIKGFTRPYALIYKGDLIVGEELNGLSELEKYIQEKTQKLYNERVLDSVTIDYVLAPVREDGKYPVDIIIDVKDTWNIVAIPRPKISSNSGYEITLKARDYNFLGTMTPLRLDIGYIFDEEEKHSVILGLDSNTLFRLFNHNWFFLFVNDFVYRADTEQPYYYKNKTGLSVEFPVKKTTITAGFIESFILNEENPDNYKTLYGNFQDGFYMTSSPYVTWEIPTGLEVGVWDELIYLPGITAVFYHEFSEWPLDEIRNGPVLSFKNNLGFKRIDWLGNFRNGLDVSVDSSFDLNFYRLNNNENPWSSKFVFSGIGHFKILDFFGISTELKFRHWHSFEEKYKDFFLETNAGDVLRGILDKEICADYMLSLNLDFPFRILRFAPSKWADKEKLRIFNFELYLSPILDFALYHDPINKKDFNFQNILVTGGFEVIIFPEYFRSLYLRISYGRNFTDSYLKSKNEIYVGTDFHF